MNNIMKLLSWVSLLDIIVSIVFLGADLNHTEHMELGVFVIIPVDVFWILISLLLFGWINRINATFENKLYKTKVVLLTVFVVFILLPISAQLYFRGAI